MKRQYVYLAGSMEHVDDATMNDWRDYATEQLASSDIEVLNPTRRMALHNQSEGETYNNLHRIVQQDLQDISQSRVVLADLRDSQAGKKWGTVMEIAIAQRDRRAIIVLVDEGQFKHPFIYTFATEVHTDLDDAIEAVTQYYN